MEVPQLGRYVVLSELGRGAMGIVYKATDTVLERTVAIKTINMALERDGADRYEARFYQEARAAAGLNHPNIVVVHDVGKAGEVMFMAMEYIEGVELRTLLGEGRPVRLPQALSIVAQVAEGLAYAHSKGVVHRDIKPANIMVVPNAPVKITDFGIARRRAASDLTQTGMLLGSPKYMSPEQVIGKRADQRSDIFSLGVILYELLTGVAPFNGENVTALMYQTVNFLPPAPSQVNSAVPPLLDHIVARMLAKPLEERYPDAAEAARDLRECERQLGASASATSPGTATTLPLSAQPQMAPQLVDPHVQTVVLGQTRSLTRQADQQEAQATAPAKGLAPAFNSAEATQRLAVLTGNEGLGATTVRAAAPETATQAVKSMPRGSAGWRRRDWLIVAGAAACGLTVAASLFKREER